MRIIIGLTAGAVATVVAASILWGSGEDSPKTYSQDRPVIKTPEGSPTLVLGAGCFWCVEPLFEMMQGVYTVESGYAGGKLAAPTYEDVLTGRSGHAEVIKITFDPEAIRADDLLRIFFTVHDPTTLDRQGPDAGPQYRSAVFYETEEEKGRAERIMAEITKEGIWDAPLVTKIEPLLNYTRAEEYHQDYYRKFEKASPAERMRMNSGYCRVIISPKVNKFRQKFDHLLKK